MQTLINPLSSCRTLCPELICWEEKIEWNLREFTQFYLIYEIELKNAR